MTRSSGSFLIHLNVMDALQHIITAVVLFVTGLFGSPIQPSPEIAVTSEYAEVVEVIDGDTIVVDIEGKKEFVRYIGVDTPETTRDGKEEECFAAEATKANTQLVARRQVRLESDTDDRDKYNRLLRYVYADEVFVNRELVEEGYATVLTIPPNTEYAQEFKMLETKAKEGRVGMWGVCE